MIGKPKWFQRRKYTGWGLSPKTWEGWVYILVIAAIAMLIQYLPIDKQAKPIATIVLVAIIILDLVHIIAHLPMDERERNHEAISERNALWAILAALGAGAAWQAITGVMTNNIQIDPIIIIALAVATIAKAITNIYLDMKN
jgi:hypothetical protein